MPEVAVGPLGHVVGGVAELRSGLDTANALMVLQRTAVLDGSKLDESAQLNWAVRTSLGYDGDLATAVLQRRTAARDSVQHGPDTMRLVALRPDTALLVGAGESGVRNVGMALHGTYGWPVLRGSALKGVAHAYARDVERLAPADLARIFGTPRPESADPADTADGDAADGDPAQGTVAFLDAVWTSTAPRVAAHVLTPHVAPYYRDGKGETPPAEYWNPVPVEYLAVEDGVFVAGLVGPAPAVEHAESLLLAGLADLGIGAKTAAGYGYLTPAQGGGR